ncbi:ornithine carbamoyltransferase, partial [Candidatus Bathyarchaeota archaeon]|nr:ornithine carbamoyltransferase [Candidatus Bathyarchaeota archaeon]
MSDFDLSKKDIDEILALSEEIKADPAAYGDSMKNKTL